MKAYCIVYERLHDLKMFDEYRKQVMPTIEAYGGRFLVRGGKLTALEGDMPLRSTIAMLEFPSRKAAEDWSRSPGLSEDPAPPHQCHGMPVHRGGRRRLALISQA